MDFGSVANAIVNITTRAEAVALQDLAAERCTMPYRAPELFDVKSQCVIDDKVDIWVGDFFFFSFFFCSPQLLFCQSFGCLMYAMAYGEGPFEHVLSEPGSSIAMAVQSGRIVLPSDDP